MMQETNNKLEEIGLYLSPSSKFLTSIKNEIAVSGNRTPIKNVSNSKIIVIEANKVNIVPGIDHASCSKQTANNCIKKIDGVSPSTSGLGPRRLVSSADAAIRSNQIENDVVNLTDSNDGCTSSAVSSTEKIRRKFNSAELTITKLSGDRSPSNKCSPKKSVNKTPVKHSLKFINKTPTKIGSASPKKKSNAKSPSTKSSAKTPVKRTPSKLSPSTLNSATYIVTPKKLIFPVEEDSPIPLFFGRNGKSPEKNKPRSPLEKINFSPKMVRRPGKYFDKDSMPEELSRSPTKSPSPKKRLTPRKKSLFKSAIDPKQKKIFEFCEQNGLTSTSGFSKEALLNDDMILMTESRMEHALNIISNEEKLRLCMAEYKEKVLNTPPKKQRAGKSNSSLSSTAKDMNGHSTNSLMSPNNNMTRRTDEPVPSSTPGKSTNKPADFTGSFMFYLLSNPTITLACRRRMFSSMEFAATLRNFKNLPGDCQMIYSKLFGRTLRWYRIEDLIQQYGDSFSDIKGIFSTLKENNLISEDLNGVELTDLLTLLKVKELKKVCNHFNVNINDSGAKKDTLMGALLNHASTQKVLFNGSLSNKIKARVIKELGHCVCLNDDCKELFHLLVILASYPYYMDEEKKRLSDFIFKFNELKYRKITYPPYEVRPDLAFQDIRHLTDYSEALKIVSAYSDYVEKKLWTSAAQVVVEVKNKFSNFLADERNKKLLRELGGHLLKFTAGYQFCFCLSDGITVLKKFDTYTDECLEIIELLLSQSMYLQRKRGIWYDEMALIYTKRKDLAQACRAVIRGLKDDKVDEIRKRMLSQRASTLLKRKSNSALDGLKAELNALVIPDGFKPQNHTIVAKSHEGIAGRKQIFYRESEDGKTYSSVEEIVIDHYQTSVNPPYAHGLHDEGRTLMNIILGCFYDVIYSHPEGDSLFHCHMQTHPLDWGGRHFYERRERLIQNQLEKLSMGGVPEIMSTLNDLCLASEGITSVVRWDYIAGEKLYKIKELLECLGHHVFLCIAEHVMKDYKTYHSGFPDLIMWDPPTKRCVFIEVKGPNDRLSMSQMVWLEKLSNFGAHALVCHVENQGSRKRKAT